MGGQPAFLRGSCTPHTLVGRMSQGGMEAGVAPKDSAKFSTTDTKTPAQGWDDRKGFVSMRIGWSQVFLDYPQAM